MDAISAFFTQQALRYLMDQGPNVIEKLASDPEEAKKHCGVCGVRIKGGAKFKIFTRRFYCTRCGHRTHVHCAADLKEQICRKCA